MADFVPSWEVRSGPEVPEVPELRSGPEANTSPAQISFRGCMVMQ